MPPAINPSHRTISYSVSTRISKSLGGALCPGLVISADADGLRVSFLKAAPTDAD